MSSAEHQSGEFGLQYRVALAYRNIERLIALRWDLQGKAMKPGKQAAAAGESAEAIWWGICSIRDDLGRELEEGRKAGLLPVLWAREHHPTRLQEGSWGVYSV